jgi:hypothetical protein
MAKADDIRMGSRYIFVADSMRHVRLTCGDRYVASIL